MNKQNQIVGHVAGMVVDTIKELTKDPFLVPTGISARHVHLTREAAQELFGRGYSFTFFKKLSQPGQYAAAETVELIGPKGKIGKVRILAPERPACQVEISVSDGRKLGIAAPVKASGDLKGTPGICLRGPAGEIRLSSGVIIAERHVHMSPEDAKWFEVKDGQQVNMAVSGPKAGIMGNVTVRVSESYRLDFHIDTDDANAFMIGQGEKVTLLKK